MSSNSDDNAMNDNAAPVSGAECQQRAPAPTLIVPPFDPSEDLPRFSRLPTRRPAERALSGVPTRRPEQSPTRPVPSHARSLGGGEPGQNGIHDLLREFVADDEIVVRKANTKRCAR